MLGSVRSAEALDPDRAVTQYGSTVWNVERGLPQDFVTTITQCYERTKMDAPNLKGTVNARITVGLDGKVTKVTIQSSTLNSPSVESCITREVARFHLPAPTGGPISFTYPFVFD